MATTAETSDAGPQHRANQHGWTHVRRSGVPAVASADRTLG